MQMFCVCWDGGAAGSAPPGGSIKPASDSGWNSVILSKDNEVVKTAGVEDQYQCQVK